MRLLARIGAAPPRPANPQTSSRFVDTAPKPSAAEATVTRDESSKLVITEDDVRGLEPGAVLRIGEGARLTPLAADVIQEKNIAIVRRTSRRGSKSSKMIAVGADHGGFEMKEELKAFPPSLDIASMTLELIPRRQLIIQILLTLWRERSPMELLTSEHDDGAGVGSAWDDSEQVPGVRAAACYSVAVARNSREHNDANVLTLGSSTITEPRCVRL